MTKGGRKTLYVRTKPELWENHDGVLFELRSRSDDGKCNVWIMREDPPLRLTAAEWDTWLKLADAAGKVIGQTRINCGEEDGMMFAGCYGEDGWPLKRPFGEISDTAGAVNVVVYPCGGKYCWFDPKDWFADEDDLDCLSGGDWHYSMHQVIKKYSNEGKYIYLSSEMLEDSFEESLSAIGAAMARMCLWSQKTARFRAYVPAWYSYMLSYMNERLLSPLCGTDLAGGEDADKKLFAKAYPSGGLRPDNGTECTPLDCLHARTFGRWLLETQGDRIIRKIIESPGSGMPALEKTTGMKTDALIREFALDILGKALSGNDDSPHIFGHDARYRLMPYGCAVTYIGTTDREGECRLNFGSMTVGRNERLYIAIRRTNDKRK